MKAITQDVYGTADVLRYADVDVPTPGPGEVLIKVRAAGVDYGVWHQMTGLPLIARLGFGVARPKTAVPGMDVAGVVEAVGAGVTRFRAGDEVFGSASGTFAEYAVASPKKLAHKPAALTFEQAGALGVSGCTALKALAGLRTGQSVLVIGASGGVGSFAVQLAKLLGAGQVTGVCSTAKLDFVRSLGADQVIDYTREPISGRHDLILDIGGNRTLAELRRCLTGHGTLVVVGGENGGRVTGGIGRSMLRAPLLGMFTRQKLRGLLSLVRAVDLERLAELGVAPAIERSYPLADAADAVRHLTAGRARGKLVITM
jgi:NADPH:quinone reductase-like Zn-dependent oxidoreductase